MTRRHKYALTAALLICICIVPLAAAGGATSLPAWGTEPSPNGGFPRNVLGAVDVISTTDAWAVGRYDAAGFNGPRPLVQHWDGAEWSVVSVPWSEESELLGVAALAPDDVWMVGGYESGGQALIAHWDGSALSLVPHPNPGEFNRLYAVAAVAEDDIWAVGEFTNPISRTLALHWDGSAWTQVATPNGGDGYNQLNGVTAVATDDVWAVGDSGNSTLSLHWDGSQWTTVSTPSPGSTPTLRAVSATSSTNVWAVGDSGNGTEGSLTMRWDGAQWNVVPSPNPQMNFLNLTGVTALSPSDAWAVGVYDVRGNWRALTMHWDGSDWTVVAAPSPDPVINVLYGVAASSASDVWAVGSGGGAGSLAVRWDGSAWTRSLTPNEGTGNNVLTAISARSSQDIWAVGNAQDRSLSLHFDGSAWTIVPSPNREYGVRLEDVVAIGENDAWAVGWSGSNGSVDDENVAMHWDGTAWSIVPTPQPGGADVDRLLAVDAAGPNDVWATGFHGIYPDDHSVILHWDGTAWNEVAHDCDTQSGLTGITVVSAANVWAVGHAETCHYDGSSWTEVPSPQPRPEHYEIWYPLEDVSAVSPKDVWAVGARVIQFFEYPEFQSFAEHWDGTEWTRVVNMPGTHLYGVEAVSAHDVWAVGTDSYGPLIVHFDGSAWSEVPTPEARRGGRLSGLDSIVDAKRATPSSPLPSPRELWAAGNFYPGTQGSRTLIERAPSGREGAVVGHTNVSYATVSWFGPETGSTETDPFGDYDVGGLLAGTYTFIATNPGCAPDSATVTVVAGRTLRQDFQIGCPRSARRGPQGGARMELAPREPERLVADELAPAGANRP